MQPTPKSLIEAVRYFSDLRACNDYMRWIKWPDGRIVCPKCGSRIESGERNDPTLSTAERLARALKCKIEALSSEGTDLLDSPQFIRPIRVPQHDDSAGGKIPNKPARHHFASKNGRHQHDCRGPTI